jgi:outer membrane protein assembly factor BamB
MTKLRFIAVTLFLGSLVLLTGCAGLDTMGDMVSSIGDLFADEDKNDPPATLAEDYVGEIEIDMLWQDSVGVGAENKALKLIPVVRNSNLYVADFKGIIQARAIANGEVIWETKTDFNYAAGPGINEKLLIMGTNHGEVVAFDINSGNQLWVTTVSSEVLAVPVIVNGKVIIRTTDGKIIALSEADGSVQWSAEHSVPALSIRGAGKPLVMDDTLIIGAANGKLVNLQIADGKLLWEATISIPSGRSEIDRLVDLDVDPIESRGMLFICSYQGGTFAVSKTDGDVIWRNESVSSYTGIGYDSRYLYISDNHGEVSQVDQRNGGSLWKQKDLHNRGLSAASNYQEYVVVGDYEGYVHWLSSSDGHLMGRIKVAKTPVETKPIIVDGIVYVYSKDGILAALKVR